MMQAAAGSLLLSDEQGSYPALTGMVPAESGRRILGRVLEALFVTIASALSYAIWLGAFVGALNAASYGDEAAVNGFFGGMIAAVLPAVAFLIAQLYCWVKKGNHVGGAVLGLVNVDVATGERSAGKTVGKNLLINLIGSLTAGIVPLIVCLATIKGSTQRNAFDRMLGVMVVDTKKGEGPRKPGTEPTVVTQPIQDQRKAIESVSLAPGSAAPPTTPVTNQAVVPIPSPIPSPAIPVGRVAAQAGLLPPETAAPKTPQLPSFSDPFADSVGDVKASSPIHQVGKPGSDVFIESTPLSGSRPPEPVQAAAPVADRPIVVREMASVAADEVAVPGVDQTVVDADAFTPPPSVEPAKVTALVLDDTIPLSASEITLLGRNPIGGAAVTDLGPTVALPVEDPDMGISKTHLAVAIDDGNWWVIDLRSTNGVQLIAADGSSTKIEPGMKTSVPAGASVRFGKHHIKALP